jgi:hypothetical protein
MAVAAAAQQQLELYTSIQHLELCASTAGKALTIALLIRLAVQW